MPKLDMYRMSMDAFKKFWKRTATLEDKDHGWIMGWQQGFKAGRRYPSPKIKGDE